jgi:type II secretory pathway pseudopilin PulG
MTGAIRKRARRAGRRPAVAFTLAEVLVAAFVLAVLLVPVAHMFLTSAGGAGQDVREVAAASLAQEVLEQVIAAQRLSCTLHAVPPENAQPGAAGRAPGAEQEKELDVDRWLAEFDREMGAPLFRTKAGPRVTRMFLSPSRPGFRRFLSIVPVATGRDRGSFLAAPALYRATARVEFTTPLPARVVVKSVRVSTLLYMDPHRTDEDETLR